MQNKKSSFILLFFYAQIHVSSDTCKNDTIQTIRSVGKDSGAFLFPLRRTAEGFRRRTDGKGQNMALTRKMLKGMGIEDEKIDLIIEAHAEAVDGLKDELKTAKADADRLKDTQKELEDLKAKDHDGWKDKYDKLNGEFEQYKSDVLAKETRAAKESAYRAILKDADLSERGIEKALKYAEWNNIELGDDGKVKGAADHIKAIKTDWAEYVTSTTTTGANTSNPPTNNGGNQQDLGSLDMAAYIAARKQK
jgi:hypothetical protein